MKRPIGLYQTKDDTSFGRMLQNLKKEKNSPQIKDTSHQLCLPAHYKLRWITNAKFTLTHELLQSTDVCTPHIRKTKETQCQATNQSSLQLQKQLQIYSVNLKSNENIWHCTRITPLFLYFHFELPSLHHLINYQQVVIPITQ